MSEKKSNRVITKRMEYRYLVSACKVASNGDLYGYVKTVYDSLSEAAEYVAQCISDELASHDDRYAVTLEGSSSVLDAIDRADDELEADGMEWVDFVAPALERATNKRGTTTVRCGSISVGLTRGKAA